MGRQCRADAPAPVARGRCAAGPIHAPLRDGWCPGGIDLSTWVVCTPSGAPQYVYRVINPLYQLQEAHTPCSASSAVLAPRPCRRRSCSRLRSDLAPRCSLTLHHGKCSAIDTVHDGVRATAGFSDLLRGDWVLIPQVPASAGRAFDRHPPPAPPLAQLDVFLHRALQIVAVSRPGQALSLRIESCASQQPQHCS